MNKKKIIIFGAGQFGHYVLDIINRNKEYDFLGFIDKAKKKYVIGNDNYFKKNINKKFKNVEIIIAIFEKKLRKKIINLVEKYKLPTPNLIDKTSIVSDSIIIGTGNIIGTNSVISNGVKIGSYNLIGTSVNLLHNCKLGNNNIIAGGTNIGANVIVQNDVFMGVGSVIASGNIRIKENSYICAGSVVLRNLEKGSKVLGNPAKKII